MTYFFAVLMLVFAVYAVMSRSILRSAIGLALASASLAVTCYSLGADLMAVFELSVCSGLVTVIFIAGVSLSHSPKVELQSEYQDHKRNRGLPILLICAGAALMLLALLTDADQLLFAPDKLDNVREVFWNTRQADIWGQMAATLCGGVAVAVLFREERRG